MTVLALLTVSCNKNRFDFSELNSVEVSGQWKLPIGSTYITLDRVLDQLAENEMVSYDESGNIQVSYRYAMDTVVTGTDFMHFDDMFYDVSLEAENPYPFVLEEPIEGVLHLEREVVLESETLRLLSAKIRSGQFLFELTSTLGNIQEIIVKSPNIFDADGASFERSIQLDGVTPVDLSGVHFEAQEVNTLRLFYEIHYQAYDFTAPMFEFYGSIEVRDLMVQEMSGWVNSYPTDYRIDSAFSLPFDNLQGALNFVDAHFVLYTRNSFDLPCLLRIDTALLYGDDVENVQIFDQYPLSLYLAYSIDYEDLMDESLHISLNTGLQALLSSGTFILNPNGFGESVTIYDTATIGIAAEGLLPMKFNIPGVMYNDTVDLDLSEVDAPDLIKEVQLTMIFESELPFNLEAQFFTTDAETGMVTDSLFSNDFLIHGSFDHSPVSTESVVLMTRDRFANLMATKQLLMRLVVDTGHHDVQLNLQDGLRLTMKADVVYEGDLTDLEK